MSSSRKPSWRCPTRTPSARPCTPMLTASSPQTSARSLPRSQSTAVCRPSTTRRCSSRRSRCAFSHRVLPGYLQSRRSLRRPPTSSPKASGICSLLMASNASSPGTSKCSPTCCSSTSSPPWSASAGAAVPPYSIRSLKATLHPWTSCSPSSSATSTTGAPPTPRTYALSSSASRARSPPSAPSHKARFRPPLPCGPSSASLSGTNLSGATTATGAPQTTRFSMKSSPPAQNHSPSASPASSRTPGASSGTFAARRLALSITRRLSTRT